MSALGQARSPVEVKFKTVPLPLKTVLVAWSGGMACIDSADNTVKPGVSGNATLTRIGNFAESLDNSANTASANVLVKLDKELVAQWYDNATGAAAVVGLFTNAYILDDHTVQVTAGGNSIAGRVWAIDATKGVLVETTNL
jgi:hypothetical protein